MPGKPTVQFLGAAGTVTGSKHLVSLNGRRVLLDCGLFQGLKELRLRNWSPPPFAPRELDALILSHVHIDHSGYLPVVVRDGFRGPIYCTPATKDLLAPMLRDAAHLQEEEADGANRWGYSKHKPALPLYTIADAEAVLDHLMERGYGQPFSAVDGIDVTFRRAGHIMGSATIEVALAGPRALRLAFSGDLGRWDRPILRDPDLTPQADTLLLESTYGGRTHPTNSREGLARVVRQAAERGGALVVPAFALGRTQEIVWLLRELETEGRIPVLPVYVDSPMAIDVTEIYAAHREEYDMDMDRLVAQGRSPLRSQQIRFTRTADESKKLNDLKGPIIIISASGMATGGRVLHHLKLRAPDPRTTILLPGFQSVGTRGRALQDGARELRIHGQMVDVRARVETLDGLSAHADQGELIRWCRGFTSPPKRVHLVHGEPDQAQILAGALQEQLGWNVNVARDREVVEIG